jgi:general secretion pathway protein J
MKARSRAAGFTLVEILIALALTGLVTLLMVSATRFAVLGLDRITGAADRLEARRTLEDLLRRELAGTLASPLLPNASIVVGRPDSITFLTLADDSGAGLYRVAIDAETVGASRALMLTRWRSSAGGDGPPEHVLLAPRIGAFHIDYFGALGVNADPKWQDAWQGVRTPPTLVRMTIDTRDGLARPPLIVHLWASTD